MSFRTTVHESLPYIDAEPTPAERSAAESLIAAELSSSPSPSPSTPTPNNTALPPLREPRFSALITSELARIEQKQPLRAIDTSRYEDVTSTTSDTTTSTSQQQQQLSRAYAIATYLSGRETHLRLLDAHGRNAWLVGNWQAEAVAAVAERELAAARREVDRVSVRRRRAQEEAAGELRSLEAAWRRGVGRVLEAEAAAEGVRREVLALQRERGVGA
ncbi:hypothetical protein SLS62_003275 [Diatrype stigma]|uniref:Pre-mRNA-splicing factor SPF27 n=1 Tax=Diatrype stigma TaxID=117547 RepID=A0AAN9UWV2_9PEZI